MRFSLGQEKKKKKGKKNEKTNQGRNKQNAGQRRQNSRRNNSNCRCSSSAHNKCGGTRNNNDCYWRIGTARAKKEDKPQLILPPEKGGYNVVIGNKPDSRWFFHHLYPCCAHSAVYQQKEREGKETMKILAIILIAIFLMLAFLVGGGKNDQQRKR